jgi:cation transport protein ChaC
MDQGDLWIFAYGSLMWRPDFSFVSRHRARLNGYHRALCIYSNHYRGTPSRPGLVLGLDRGGSCVGIAFRVAAAAREATHAAVRARELITHVYNEIEVEVLLEEGSRARAITYVANLAHAQNAGKHGGETVLACVRHGLGVAGPNSDYVRNTHRHLKDLGVADARLTAVVEALDGPPAKIAMP